MTIWTDIRDTAGDKSKIPGLLLGAFDSGRFDGRPGELCSATRDAYIQCGSPAWALSADDWAQLFRAARSEWPAIPADGVGPLWRAESKVDDDADWPVGGMSWADSARAAGSFWQRELLKDRKHLRLVRLDHVEAGQVLGSWPIKLVNRRQPWQHRAPAPTWASELVILPGTCPVTVVAQTTVEGDRITGHSGWVFHRCTGCGVAAGYACRGGVPCIGRIQQGGAGPSRAELSRLRREQDAVYAAHGLIR